MTDDRLPADPKRQPWMKFFPSDWRADPALRMCSFAARGLWVDLMTLMHEAEPYGHLLVSGKSPTARQLSGLLGGGLKEIEALLAELEEAGVFSKTDEGVIYSRRMTRDHARAQKDKANGKGGGNPRLKGAVKGSDNPPLNPGVNPQANPGVEVGDKAQKPEARSQRPEPSSEASAPFDPRATRFIETFDRVLVETYGPEHARPWPQAADSVHAQRALDAGWTEHAAEALFRDRLAKRRERNKPPPGGLAWFEKAFAEASRAARTAEDVPDSDPRAQAFNAAARDWLSLPLDDQRRIPRPRREQFGLPSTPEAAP
ncbi:MAG: hypothetical protein ING19_20760 [Azospirillum sp.]|nr:hypothetical protein [Azospirillum sp.]